MAVWSKIPVSLKMVTNVIIENNSSTVSMSIHETISSMVGLSFKAAKIATDIVLASIAANVLWVSWKKYKLGTSATCFRASILNCYLLQILSERKVPARPRLRRLYHHRGWWVGGCSPWRPESWPSGSSWTVSWRGGRTRCPLCRRWGWKPSCVAPRVLDQWAFHWRWVPPKPPRHSEKTMEGDGLFPTANQLLKESIHIKDVSQNLHVVVFTWSKTTSDGLILEGDEGFCLITMSCTQTLSQSTDKLL